MSSDDVTVTVDNDMPNGIPIESNNSQPTSTTSYNTYQVESGPSFVPLKDKSLADAIEESCVFSDPEVDHPYFEDEATQSSTAAQRHNVYTPHSHVHLKLISTQQEPLVTPHSISDDLCIDIE